MSIKQAGRTRALPIKGLAYAKVWRREDRGLGQRSIVQHGEKEGGMEKVWES